MKRGLVIAVLAIGLGLVAAPAIFQMFTRAPLGGGMINDFRPFMAQSKVEQFQSYMARIDDVHAETTGVLPKLAEQRAGISPQRYAARFPSLAAFNERWPAIFEDMNNGMLTTMDEMVDNFAAVDALPPFVMFPWFFVLPGLIIAFLAFSALRVERRGGSARGRVTLLAVMGIGLIAAPAIFQMFTRAPKGAEMIDEFRPLMTKQKLATVQGYFLVIGAAEGELRAAVEPALKLKGGQLESELPAIASLHPRWGTISGNMAPMIGAMADNIDNYEAVDALPPFTLFPWFFVAPGVMVAALALWARPRKGQLSGRDAFGLGMPAPADPTQAFFQSLKEKADVQKDLTRTRSTGGVPAGISMKGKGE